MITVSFDPDAGTLYWYFTEIDEGSTAGEGECNGTLLLDRVRTAILIYEPRIKVLALSVDSRDPNSGDLDILLEYEVRATNSRFNLVFPFYRTDGNELRAAMAPGGGR